MAGYSGTLLIQKLGVKPGHRLVLVSEPTSFRSNLGVLPEGLQMVARLAGVKNADVVICFVTSRAEFTRRLAAATKAMAQDGAVWVAWPKKASKVPTDMTEDVIREVALPSGLVDNKVCAIDDVWSGLRLVIRKELRRPKPARTAQSVKSPQKKRER